MMTDVNGWRDLTLPVEVITVAIILMSGLSSIWFLAVALAAGSVAYAILAGLWLRLNDAPGKVKISLFIVIAATSFLLMRPHEDSFTGLDTSCYRLMAHAFTAGRGLHDVDQTLLNMPPQQRRAVLLEYKHWGRDTRDRSFEIPSLANCVTQPYFYPFLPMAATGLETVTRVIPGDYFIPLVGVLFFTVILVAGAATGHLAGWIAALALLLGTPLPLYFFRGYYAEAAGAALAALVLLGQAYEIHRPAFRFSAPILLGLAVCFHPVAIALSLPALILILADPGRTRRGTWLSLAGFGIGLAPLPAMTRWGCQPYGDIIDIRVLLGSLASNDVHRLLAIFVMAFILAVGIAIFSSPRLKSWIRNKATVLMDNRFLFLACLLLALTPLLLPVALWPGKKLVIVGLHEFQDSVRWGYGLILLAGVIATFSRTAPLFSRALLILAVLLSPLFFYLKGFEQMGLWSQRRLVPLALLLIVALTPALSLLCGRYSSRRWLGAGFIALLVAATLANPLRWPAPWLARHEHDTAAWVAGLASKLGTDLTAFDYHPYAVPFSLMPHARVIGLSQYGLPALPGLMNWISTRATREPVLVVTAYDNPGLEDGMTLTSRSHEAFTTTRVVSKTSLPAETRLHTFEMEILTVSAVTNQHSLSVHKILDDGPLALRGSWGRGSPIQDGNTLLPARWSREGCGIIGPIPEPGQPVSLTVVAAASRDDGVDGQILRIQPPWAGPALSLVISNGLTRASGLLTRPPATFASVARTGIYRIFATTPYNPGRVGIRGYEPDLGAQIHSITINEP